MKILFEISTYEQFVLYPIRPKTKRKTQKINLLRGTEVLEKTYRHPGGYRRLPIPNRN